MNGYPLEFEANLRPSQRFIDSPRDPLGSIREQLALASYRLPPIESARLEPDKQFDDNTVFWEAACNQPIGPETVVGLYGFNLFEWFPQTPGLFRTPEAEKLRKYADSRKVIMPDGTEAYDVHGKLSMIRGGIASVRLAAIAIRAEDFYFMSASSTTACHEGVPVALPAHLYRQCIEEIREYGAARCDLVGRLKSIPPLLERAYQREIPRLYIEVESLRRHRPIWHEFVVGVASAFAGHWDGRNGIFSTYATFNPGVPQSLYEAARWIEEDYVAALHHGRVLTDFDQQRSHFADAPFSIEKVMSLRIGTPDNIAALRSLDRSLNGLLEEQFAYEREIKITIERLEVAHMDARSFNQTATGSNITQTQATDGGVANVTITQTEAAEKSLALVAELGRLVDQLKSHVDPAQAEVLDRHRKTLEDAEKKKDRAWYSVSLDGLTEAAVAVGALGKPILETIAKLRPLIGIVTGNG